MDKEADELPGLGASTCDEELDEPLDLDGSADSDFSSPKMAVVKSMDVLDSKCCLWDVAGVIFL